MASLKELETALINADKAGDTQAAQVFAAEIQKMRTAGYEKPAEKKPEKLVQTGAVDFVPEKPGFWAQAGKVLTDYGLGIKQRLAEVGTTTANPFDNPYRRSAEGLGPNEPAPIVSELREEVRKKRETDKPFEGMSWGGAAGNMIASIPLMKSRSGGAVGGILGFLQPSLSDEETAVNTGLGILGGKAGDVLLGGANRFVTSAKNKVAALKAQNAPRDAVIAASKQAGYVLPPSAVGKRSLLESVGGKLSTEKLASIKNQAVTNRLAAESLGLPADQPITKAVLSDLRKQAGVAYENLKALPDLPADNQFNTALQGIGRGYRQFVQEFPELANKDVDNVIAAVGKNRFTMNGAVEAIKRLRNDASGNLAAAVRTGDPAKRALGRAQKEAAGALEDLIERKLQASGQQDLLQAFRSARELIAKSHDIQSALMGTRVSARKLANIGDKKTLTGGLKTAADMAKEFEDLVKVQKGSAINALGPSILDVVASGGLSGIVGAAGAGPASLLPLSWLAARPAARFGILSAPYQRAIVNPSYSPGMLANLLDKSAAQQAIRLGPVSGLLSYAAQQ